MSAKITAGIVIRYVIDRKHKDESSVEARAKEAKGGRTYRVQIPFL